MMDASATNMAISQINFIEFVVAPLYAHFVRLFPETSTLVGHLVDNRIHYQVVLENELDNTAPSANPHAPVSTAVAAAAATGNPISDLFTGGVAGAPPLGTQAGAGKTFSERLNEKGTSRNRFKALVEKHGLLQSPAAAYFSSNSAYDILMLGGAGGGPEGGSGGGKGGLTSLPVSEFGSSFQSSVRRERFDSNGSTSSTGSAGGTARRTLFQGVRGAIASTAGTFARRPSSDMSRGSGGGSSPTPDSGGGGGINRSSTLWGSGRNV